MVCNSLFFALKWRRKPRRIQPEPDYEDEIIKALCERQAKYKSPEEAPWNKEKCDIVDYGEGHICLKDLDNEEIKNNYLPDELKNTETFVLPLKRYAFCCPVCGHRTLGRRGYYEICVECGWEDDGSTTEDDPGMIGGFLPGPNGDYTLSSYRKEYLKKKEKDPNYSWKNEFKKYDEDDE